jgi:hypothetical protein
VVRILYTLALFNFGLLHHSLSQHIGPEAEPVTVVRKLFEGMQKGDSAMVHSVFASQVTLVTIFRNKAGDPVIKHESSIQDFLKAVGTPHKEVWHEEVWNIKVEIDGDLAQVWCDYAFYLDDRFSHCGVDAFLLHKEKEGWKIFHLADTRRKTDCSTPQLIKDKHNGN